MPFSPRQFVGVGKKLDAETGGPFSEKVISKNVPRRMNHKCFLSISGGKTAKTGCCRRRLRPHHHHHHGPNYTKNIRLYGTVEVSGTLFAVLEAAGKVFGLSEGILI